MVSAIVIKRNGEKQKFSMERISRAISKANEQVGSPMSFAEISNMESIIDEYFSKTKKVSVEEIQDAVEDVLIQYGNKEVAKAYIRYRQTHTDKREIRSKLDKIYEQIIFGDAADSDLRRDNANVNTDEPMGQMLKMGAEAAKAFTYKYVIPEDIVKADKEGYIHIHDRDFSLMTFNCCQIDLGKLLKGGFNTGHGFLREPNSIRSAASLACIAIQSNQNQMFGGQSINALDFALAPYVDKSFKKAYKNNIRKLMSLYCDIQTILNNLLTLDYDVSYSSCNSEKNEKLVSEWVEKYKFVIFKCPNLRQIVTVAWKNSINDIEEETKQAMEAMIHNFNTLHSRCGAQVPFSSLNFGTDTSPEGRLVIDKLLDAIWNGLGHGETSIFPISVMKLKSGVNYNPEDPNHDLFQKACKVSAKRLFPNFNNLDAPYNLKYYKPGDYNSEVATMGCRTVTMGNVNGPAQSGSRGNFSFTTINLPMLALDARKKYPDNQEKRIDDFFEQFDKYIYMSKEYLEERYEFIAKKHAKNFSFLMGQGVWLDGEKLAPEDEIRSVLKHSSISIGFCGLAECLKALTGKHHGESKEAQELGLKIVKHLREMTDKFTKETHMNWATFSTPAESTAGTFARACQKKFGVIEGITDRSYETNSFHVPVYYPIKAIDKIRIEAPYHAECNAGSISYIELNGDPLKNIKAFESIVRAMHDANMGYFSINHPVDRDPVCGYTGIIENECPHCHRKEAGNYSSVEKRALFTKGS